MNLKNRQYYTGEDIVCIQISEPLYKHPKLTDIITTTITFKDSRVVEIAGKITI